jgi:hypothetical protein
MVARQFHHGVSDAVRGKWRQPGLRKRLFEYARGGRCAGPWIATDTERREFPPGSEMPLKGAGALRVECPEILQAKPFLVNRDRRDCLVDRSLRKPPGVLQPYEVFALDAQVSGDALDTALLLFCDQKPP